MNAPASTALLMSGAQYRDSLRRYRPTVFVDGRRVAGCNGQGCRENGNHGSSRHCETHAR